MVIQVAQANRMSLFFFYCAKVQETRVQNDLGW